MQKFKAFIPHLFTLGNLFCGCLGIIYAFNWQLDWAAYMVFLAAFLDFFDGFFARILKVHSELGKQLDSLADMVSFGVVPGMVMFQWLKYLGFHATDKNEIMLWGANRLLEMHAVPWYCYIALMIPVFSCFRLAKFNLDTRQSHGFIGLPTPANAIFFVSMILMASGPALSYYLSSKLYWIFPAHGYSAATDGTSNLGSDPGIGLLLQYRLEPLLMNVYLMISLVVLFSFLLVSELPLFALKFKNFGWNGNKIRYLFLFLALALLICFQLTAIPFVVILYLILSILNNIFKITV
jgi:CDP-diacylglycerol--serine O-phosphatidyltransferase